MENNLNLLEALDHIDPAELCYQDWLAVGMGLKEAGYPASAWDLSLIHISEPTRPY